MTVEIIRRKPLCSGQSTIVPESRVRPTNFKDFAGYRMCKVTMLDHTSNVVVAAFKAKEQGLDPGEGEFKTPWYACCESHGSLVGCPTLAVARSWAMVPDSFCEECQRVLDKNKELDFVAPPVMIAPSVHNEHSEP